MTNCIEFVAQEKDLNHIGDILLGEHGREAYKKYPFLHIICNSPGASDDKVRSSDPAGQRTSTNSEAANSTGMFTNFMKN
jgi:hypothetical protein